MRFFFRVVENGDGDHDHVRYPFACIRHDSAAVNQAVWLAENNICAFAMISANAILRVNLFVVAYLGLDLLRAP